METLNVIGTLDIFNTMETLDVMIMLNIMNSRAPIGSAGEDDDAYLRARLFNTI